MKHNEVVKAIHQGNLPEALWKTANIMEHDIACWRFVLERVPDNPVLRSFASGRIDSLRIDIDQIYEACLALNMNKPDTQEGA